MKRSLLVTGGAAGLARGIVRALAARGYAAAFTYRPGGTPPDETLAAVRADGFDARAFPVDFSAGAGEVRDALGAAVSAIAPDVLVHAVGPMIIKKFSSSTVDDYEEMIGGNLRSSVQAAAAVLPGMRDRGFGRLIYFGLNGSHDASGVSGLSLHAAAKAGVVAFARSLALEEARSGITVNVIEPGDIRDKERPRAAARGVKAANPVGRPGTWEDVADAVAFLVRDDADFLNGVVLNVNGGLVRAYERNADAP